MDKFSFDVHIFKEAETYIAYVPALDLSSCGDTDEETRRNIRDAVRGFLRVSAGTIRCTDWRVAAMANTFGTDILIQAPDPKKAAAFYVDQLGFEITGETPMLGLHGKHINLFIERGPALGPVLRTA